MNTDPILLLLFLILAFLLITSFVFSALETALVALSRHRLKALAEGNPGKSVGIQRWLDDPNRMLTTQLIAINATNMTAAIVTEHIAQMILIDMLKWPEWTSSVFALGIVSVIVIEFCEIIPKVLAYNAAESWVLRLIRPLTFLDTILTPVGQAFMGFGAWFIKALGGEIKQERPLMTETEILRFVKTGEKQGLIDEDEREMIQSVFQFGDTEVKEIMVPRPDMVAAPLPITVAEMAAFMQQASHSRIPVYQDNIDNIVGVVNSRQLMYALKEGRDNDDVRSIMHGPYFVPETKKLDDLLEELQQKRLHMAIAVDEYGDTAGLVTMEDLLEEIVGEIRDEYDTEEPLYRWLGDNSIRVDARITIYELNEIMQTDLPEDESFDTLGGFLFDLMGKVPRRGDNAEYKDYDFVVERMSGRRISSVLIRKKPPEGKISDLSEDAPES